MQFTNSSLGENRWQHFFLPTANLALTFPFTPPNHSLCNFVKLLDTKQPKAQARPQAQANAPQKNSFSLSASQPFLVQLRHLWPETWFADWLDSSALKKDRVRMKDIHMKFAVMRSIILLGVGTLPSTMATSTETYTNVTLKSPVMSVKVFMPTFGDFGKESDFYQGSRFEHGSMIGDIMFGDNRKVYGRGLWRTPHDPTWPESGVGLASEFGCGDTGDTCIGKGDITNGVLGYDTAKNGEPFLKIGVGALIKGSCPDCAGDDAQVYNFNSPYKFYRTPKWSVLPSPGANEISFVSEESLGDYGYRIQKTVRLDGNVLTVRTLLSNAGKKQFTTPWYSHHFFSGDDVPLGPGYSLDLGLSEFGLKSQTAVFKQPGLGAWSGDMNEYVDVVAAKDGSISMNIKKPILDGVRLKANFLDENMPTLTDGSFTIRAPNGIAVFERIPELQTQSRNPFIYAYNVYIEKGTLSPEPMLLLYLQPGETTSWTQHLKFSALDKNGSTSFLSMISNRALQPLHSGSFSTMFLIVACISMIISLYARIANPRRHRGQYTQISDHVVECSERERILVV